MAKLGKRIRKGAAKIATSKIATDLLEDLIKAALIAAAAKIAGSRRVKAMAGEAEEAVAGKAGGAKRSVPRKGKGKTKVKAKRKAR